MKLVPKHQEGNPIEGLDAWEERERKRVLQLRNEPGLTPVYPEFDLLLGARGLINGAVKEGIKQVPRAAKYIYNATKKLPYSKTAHNFITGMIGGLTVDNLNKQLFGKSWGESVSEPVGYVVRKAGWNPDDTQWGRILANIGTTAAEFTNPGYLLSPAGAKQIGETAYNGAKSLVKSVDKGLRKHYPYYDLYRTISENTPKRVVDYDYFNDGELIGTTVSNLPILDLGRTLKKQANNSYFFRAPNDIDILKIGNGRYRSNLSFDGQTRLPGGQVNGKFVSYGEPWLEFGLRDDHALYEFPVGQGRPSNLIATDLRGEKLQYSVDLIFNYMQKERLGLIKLFEDEANKLGIYRINDFGEREMALLKLKEEKYPELLQSYDTSIYHANLTVIPNEQWNFENFLKEPFWKYSEDPASGLVQKTLYMNWPSYDDHKASLVLLERNPSKISLAERIGISKGDRGNLNKFQKDGLADLELYINSGQYRQLPTINMDTAEPSWVSRRGNVSAVRQLIEDGVPSTGRSSWQWNRPNGGTYELRTDGSGNFGIGYTSYRMFDVSPEFNSRVGEAYAGSALNGYSKIILTAPKNDARYFIAETPEQELAKKALIETQSPRINKEIMKDFWSGVQLSLRPGTYLSGDEGRLPKGYLLIRQFNGLSKKSYRRDNNMLIVGSGRTNWEDIRNTLLIPEKWFRREEGLSTDSYLAILKQANRENSPYFLRYSPDGFTTFNGLSIDNKFISDLLEKTKNGLASLLEFLDAFHNWVSPFGGMDAKIVDGEIVIPHPFLYKKKQGGKLNSK